ncbi:hypothetical protein M9H77_18093 [Catharanthus roseus]|uniref:Uncharacterized protein n=1 Tax=Catharanthus roseus TaxID=4058 RepID=A0ACC0B6F7_CATRO|nr:hypothetical protein M9H77_18093 [Catharanthus roseus]
MNAYFLEAHPSFGKAPDRMKNMWYTEFGKKYRWDSMHERAIWDAWQRWASLRYKDLMYEEAYKKRQEASQQNWLQRRDSQGPGKHTGGSRSFIEWAKCQKLKANMERLHIETSLPIPIDEQLMFEAVGRSDNNHVYDFGSQSTAVTTERRGGSSNSMSSVPSVSSAAGHEACIERGGGCGDTCSRHRIGSPAS